MSVAPLGAGRHSIRGSRPTTQNVEEGFRLEGPGQADAVACKDRPPGYRGDLRLLHQRGVRAQGAAMRFASLRRRYPKEYAELAAEARGQGEIL